MSTLVYSQESIPVIYQNVQWGSYTGQNAGDCGGHTWFPSSGTSNYPFPNFVPDACAQPMTFYAGDGQGVNCIGKRTGDPYLLNCLQGGSTIGAVLAPRAVQPDMGSAYFYAVLANYWFCQGQMPRPWAGHAGLKLSANMVLPFVYVPGSGGLIEQCGIVFAYFVAELGNINDGSKIDVCPRIMQSQYAQGGDLGTGYEWDFGQGDQISYDSANGIPLLFPELGPSAWITNAGSGAFHIGSLPTSKPYCFTMSAAQLSASIAAINASPRVPRSNYDTNAANWQLRLINLNFEAWAPPGADPRLGLSFNGFKAWLL